LYHIIICALYTTELKVHFYNNNNKTSVNFVKSHFFVRDLGVWILSFSFHLLRCLCCAKL